MEIESLRLDFHLRKSSIRYFGFVGLILDAQFWTVRIKFFLFIFATSFWDFFVLKRTKSLLHVNSIMKDRVHWIFKRKDRVHWIYNFFHNPVKFWRTNFQEQNWTYSFINSLFYNHIIHMFKTTCFTIPSWAIGLYFIFRFFRFGCSFHMKKLGSTKHYQMNIP